MIPNTTAGPNVAVQKRISSFTSDIPIAAKLSPLLGIILPLILPKSLLAGANSVTAPGDSPEVFTEEVIT